MARAGAGARSPGHEVAATDTTEAGLEQKITGARGLTIGGLVLIYLAVAAFVGVGYYIWARQASAGASTGARSLYDFVPEILGCSIGVFAALLGVKLIRAGGASPSDPLPVVSPPEWLVLSEAMKNREDPIGEYIRLSSLTGATGFFRKLDLSGLPLATIALTIFFAISAVLFPGEKFIELTQLTLGAFIGSFVQKQVGAQGQRSVPLNRDAGADAGAGVGGSGGGAGRAHRGEAGASRGGEIVVE